MDEEQRSFLEELADRVFDRAYQRAADASRRVRAHKRLVDAQKAYQCGPNPISKKRSICSGECQTGYGYPSST